MKSRIVILCVTGILTAAATERASAQIISQGPYVRPQQVNPYRRSTLTPYLNLARGGNAAFNYYGLVRPQLDTQAQLSQLEQQSLFQQNQLANQQGLTTDVPITGRAAGFQTHYGYFQNWQGQSGGGMGAGGRSGAGFGTTNLGGQSVASRGIVGALSGGVSRSGGRITSPRSQGSRSPMGAQPGPSPKPRSSDK